VKNSEEFYNLKLPKMEVNHGFVYLKIEVIAKNGLTIEMNVKQERFIITHLMKDLLMM
jgi:hypothetical protein